MALKEAGFHLRVVAGHHKFFRSTWQSTGYIWSLSIWPTIELSLQDSGTSVGVAGTQGSPAICLLCRTPDCRWFEAEMDQAIWETVQVLFQVGL